MSGIIDCVEGIWDFKIYLLRSGSIVRGQGAMGAGVGALLGQPHELTGLLQASHTGDSSSSLQLLNPSGIAPLIKPYNVAPRTMATRPTINICTLVNFITLLLYMLQFFADADCPTTGGPGRQSASVHPFQFDGGQPHVDGRPGSMVAPRRPQTIFACPRHE